MVLSFPCSSKRVFNALILVLCALSPARAAFILSGTIPTDLAACQDTVFQITITNTDPAPTAAGTLQYCLPAGVQYAGITGLTPADLSDPRCPVFDLPALPANGSLSFQLRVRAGCIESDRGDLRDTLRITSGGTPAPPLLGSAYNLRTPVLALLPGQNWNYSGAIGDTFTRSFALQNIGFGAALYLFVIDSFAAAGLELLQTTGILNNDTLTISGADLGMAGYLGYLESATITQTFRLADCSSQSAVVAYGWACADGTVCAPLRYDQYQLSGANSPLPVLSVSLNQPFQSPRPCEPAQLELRLENTGFGPALNLSAQLGLLPGPGNPADEAVKSDCYPLTGFELADVSLSDSSGGASLLPYRFSLAGLLTDPDGPGGLSDEDGDGQFDDLAPGASVLFRSLVPLDPACKACNELFDAYFLGAQFLFSNTCRAEFVAGLSPNLPLQIGFSENVFSEELPFILDAGTVYDFKYTLDASYAGLGALCPDDSLVLEFVLPHTLSLPASFQPLFNNQPVPYWTPNDTLLNLLLPSAKGDLTLPILPLCPPDIDDSALCTPPYEPRTYRLPASLRWRCGNGCPEQFELVCIGGEHFTIDCPRPPDSSQQHGIFADSFRVQRVSLGFSDNLMTQPVDPATPGLQFQHGIPYDTVLMRAEARIEGSPGEIFDSLQLQVYYWNGFQPYFEPLSAALLLEDAETGQTLLCPNVPLGYRLHEGYHIWEANLLPLLQAGGCLSAPNIQLTPGDRLRLELYARLTEAWPDLEIEPIKDLRVRFPYVYHGDSLLCETQNAYFEGINPQFDYTLLLEFPDTVCNDLQVSVTFHQGESGRIDADFFPFEIRPLFVYDSLLVQLDAGYAYQPGSALWEYFEGDGATGTPVLQQMPLADPQTTILPDGKTEMLFLRPANLPVTDYYKGRAAAVLKFAAQTLCPPDTTKLPLYIAGHRLLAILDSVNATVNTTPIGDPDFNELNLSTFSNLSSLRQPRWVVEYCNPGPSFSLETPLLFVENGPAVQLSAAQDITNPATPLPLVLTPVDSAHTIVAGLFLGENGCRTIELTAAVSDCTIDTLRLLPGFQCANAAAPCMYPYPLDLYFIPKISLAQINVSAAPDTAVALCEPIDYTLKLINVGEGFMYDIELRLALPPAGQNLVPGSAMLSYNGTPAPLPDPAPDSAGLVWKIQLEQLPFGLEALPGLAFTSGNALEFSFQLETDCDYIDGTQFLYGINWADACGAPKQSSLFAAPPLQIIGAPTTTNSYEIDVSMDTPASYCAENTVRVIVINPGDLGPTAANEKLRFELPAAFNYVPGSLQGIHNGPTGPPAYLPFGNSGYLSFPLPAGVAAGDSLVFSFKLKNSESGAACALPFDFRAQMTQTANIACGNNSCAIDFVMLERPFSGILEKPSFALSGLNGAGLPLDSGLEEWLVQFQIENSSSIPGGGNLQLEIRLDENQDAQLDASDPLLSAFAVQVEGLQPGTAQTVQEIVQVATTKGCSGLWALLVDTLCSCTLDTVFIPFIRLQNAGVDTVLCAGAALNLGFPALNQAVYEWLPASPYLSGADIPDPQYLYTGPFAPALQHVEILVLKSTRAQGCVSFDTVRIETRKVLADLMPAPVLCWGDSTGSVLAAVQGAADTILYSWSTGAQHGPLLDSLPAGNYSLTATDAYGCTAAGSAEVTEPPLLEVALTASDYNGYGISCAGAQDGSLEATATGGTGSYQFAWSPAGTGPLLVDLAPGSYTLTLSDANGCTLTATATLNEPPPLSMVVDITNEICPDAANGSIAVAVQGGVAPYSSGGQTVAAVFVLDNLPAGNYTVLVSDANGCTVSADTVLALLFSEFSIETYSARCFGDADGRAEIAGTGYPPFSFAWSAGGSGPVVTGPAGPYSCTVTDALGCTYVLTVDIDQPPLLEGVAAVQPVGCFGDSTGQIGLSAVGGVAPYLFFQNGQPVGTALGGLPAGLYNFEVEDANGCSASFGADLLQPEPLTLMLDATDAICFGSNTGSIGATAGGGTQPYALSWSTGASGALLDSIPAGVYTVTLTDAAGCSRPDSAAVGQPAPYDPVFDVERLPCADRANGILAVSGFPDGTRYGLNQAPAQDFPRFNGVGGGLQLLRVEDSLGCRFEFEFLMPAYPEDLGVALADTAIRLGDSAWLRIALAPGLMPGDVQFMWQNPADLLTGCDTCPALWVRPFQTTGYSALFSTASGCTSLSRIIVQVLPDSVYAPNVFYPEAMQEENRYFTLYARPEVVREITVLQIFDRWGELVFERRNFLPGAHALGWDGRFRGELALPGVYVWRAEAAFINGFVLRMVGDVTLLR